MTKQQTRHMIPNLKTREDVANFWDTHSAADYKEELEPITLIPAKHLTRTMNVRFDEQDLEKLQEVAEQKALGHQPWRACGSKSGYTIIRKRLFLA